MPREEMKLLKSSRMNLYRYLFDSNLWKKNIEKLFKSKSSYILIRASLGENKDIRLVSLTDVSKLKELEKTSKRIRAMFFSSIAHELRTPLNSILPITQQLKARFSHDKHSSFLMEVIINSAYHLENVIEDALDMSRIENNKFEIVRSSFNIRKVLDEVLKILEF